MVTIQTYLYSNIIVAQFWDPTIFSLRNAKVYANPVIIYQGIDNPIQVRVRNQDQKSIDMSGRLVQVDIQNPDTLSTEYSFGVTFTNRSRGWGNFTISKDVVDGLKQRQYKLTFRAINEATNAEQPMYIDDNFGVPLDLIVKPAYYSDMPPQEGETDDFLTIDGGTTP
jgi:hypothetical protein